MAKLKGSTNKKARYQVYKSSGRYAKNRKVKLERHLELHPEDLQAQKALKNITDKPRRSAHVASGLPIFHEITEKTVIKGKPATVVVRKIRLSRLDLQLKRQVRQASKVKVVKDDFEKTLAALSLAQTLNVLNAHTQRLHEEYIERLKKEGKPLPKSEKRKEKDNSGKGKRGKNDKGSNPRGKGKPNKANKDSK